MAAVVVAVVLAVGSAGLSLYWAVGGGALLDTMGGSTERWGREAVRLAAVALVGWAVVKLAIAAATVVATGAPTERPPSRWVRVVAWLAAAQLAVYGGLLTIGGLLVETGLVTSAGHGRPPRDHLARPVVGSVDRPVGRRAGHRAVEHPPIARHGPTASPDAAPSPSRYRAAVRPITASRRGGRRPTSNRSPRPALPRTSSRLASRGAQGEQRLAELTTERAGVHRLRRGDGG